METEWIETETEIDTVDWRGNPIHLIGVRALKNSKTGRIRVYPYDIAKAEVRDIAKKFGIEPRDVGAFLLILAKPGPFKGGEVLYKYHLQKLLFYLWKDLGKSGYGEALTREDFLAAATGPVPKNLDEDLENFKKKNWIEIRPHRWNNHTSKRIILTKEGLQLTKELWDSIPDPYKEVAQKVKERIYPLDPETIRHLVHKEYPEYRDTYIENDVE